MKCPVDSTEMLKAEQEGVEIDYCPHCRGVWLERGELEKIVDRAVGEFEEQFGPEGGEDYPERPGAYRGGFEGHGGRGYRSGPQEGPGPMGHYEGSARPEGYREERAPEGGGKWESSGPAYEDREPPQKERRRSIFDIFNN